MEVLAPFYNQKQVKLATQTAFLPSLSQHLFNFTQRANIFLLDQNFNIFCENPEKKYL